MRHVYILSIFVTTLFFTACSGEASYSLDDVILIDPEANETVPYMQGRFIDSAVEGLEYNRSSGEGGVTAKGGYYKYIDKDTLDFHVGALKLGSERGSFVITPRELAKESDVIQDAVINNRVRLMLALDQNSERLGIQIDEGLRQQAKVWEPDIDFSLSEADFTSEVDRVTHGDIQLLPTAAFANEHFEKTLRCAYSGAYQGSWNIPDTNDSSGYVGVMIQASGDVILMGDGQTVPSVQLQDGTILAEQNNSVIYVVGYDDVNTKSYSFETTVFYYYNREIAQLLGVQGSSTISGIGTSISYDLIDGTFSNAGEEGTYGVKRADASRNAAFRYTGIGVDDTGVIGLIIMDIEKDGKVIGLIHDARDITNQPQLSGNVDFGTGEISVTVDMQGEKSLLLGNLYANDTSTEKLKDVNLTWESTDATVTYGRVEIDGCQLQAVE